ncbi:hypothetical protein SAMN04488073_2978 [Marinobacter gudaonensis]|uniref:Uncharacterized protein n=1 Tax=Marinobacter gudaonensis TaxID=375760 RepID=A0A1I6HSX0_9GAMM|nr:hypothetical protein [Marinobacter gudaonensis]SFR57535.1 hypothetical protein SAMN04488073_2978 [Marinobacter gudaonensis]
MERVEQYKQTFGKFVFSEFVIFLSQIAVFFMVAVFTSNFLNSEDKLVEFANQKINSGALSEIGLTFLAILMVIGLFSAIGKVFDNKYVDSYVDEVLREMPKTIYVFGSAATATMLAISLFVYRNPETGPSAQGIAFLSLFFAFVAFVYGCGFSFAFKRKTHICKSFGKNIKQNISAPGECKVKGHSLQNIEFFNFCVADILGACYEQFPVKVDLKFDEIGSRVASQFPSEDNEDFFNTVMTSSEVAAATIRWLSSAGYLWVGNEFYGGVSNSTLTPKSLELLNMVPDAIQQKTSIGGVLASESKNLGREGVLSIVRTVLAEGAKLSLRGNNF